jgi:hypothetical protein
MRKLVGLFVAGVFVFGAASVASADDEGPNFTFGASTSFGFDINEPNAGNPAQGQNILTYSSMEQDESFNIDLVQLGINGQRGAVGYSATLDFGDLAAFAGDSLDGDVALQTAYITYDFDGVGAMAGRFGTPIGYEVLEPWGNANISRSRGWQAQPINHDGITISGSADIVDLMIGVVNNFTVADQQIAANDVDDEKGVIGSMGIGISDELSIYIAGIFTEEGDVTDVTMGNLIVSGDVAAGNSGIRYAVEGNWRENDNSNGVSDVQMWNVTGYVGTDAGPIGVDIRLDYTDDEGITTPIDTKVWSVAVTGSIPVTDGVDFRVEYRHDDADDPIFADGSGTDEAMDTIQAQLVWHPEAN